jgi:hypothetical protein
MRSLSYQCCVFSLPDCTVGTGFSPVLLLSKLAGSSEFSEFTAGLEFPGIAGITMPRRLQ